MAIRIKQFPVGKDSDITPINRFFKEAGLKTANILSAEVVNQGRDRASYIVTYEDTTAPFLFSTLPNDGDNNVGVGTPIIAIFSEAVQNVSVDDIDIFDISGTVTTQISTGLYTIDNSGASNDRGEIRILDGGYMEANKRYRITFKTSIVDLSGNPLAEQESVLIGTSVSSSDLSFDGGRISSFTQSPSLDGRYESTVTPSRVAFSDDTLLELTLRAPEDTELPEFDLHYESLVTPSGSFQAVLYSSGVLPTGDLSIDWVATQGLL